MASKDNTNSKGLDGAVKEVSKQQAGDKDHACAYGKKDMGK
jgi:hypothetical protein